MCSGYLAMRRLSTTQRYLTPTRYEVIESARAHHARQAALAAAPVTSPGTGYLCRGHVGAVRPGIALTATAAAGPLVRIHRQPVAHGELGRAPIIRNTLGQGELRARFPPRPPETSWPMTLLDADRVVAVLEEAGYYTANPEQRKVRRGGVKTVLAWLADQPGESWQQRWKSSGAEPPAADGCAPRWPGMTRGPAEPQHQGSDPSRRAGAQLHRRPVRTSQGLKCQAASS
jgi:hypothetical protein